MAYKDAVKQLKDRILELEQIIEAHERYEYLRWKIPFLERTKELNKKMLYILTLN